jgi:cytochrome oxidase Cu insertion factor (SCO1/SenC/PrrC family)/copper(I)-binding protein
MRGARAAALLLGTLLVDGCAPAEEGSRLAGVTERLTAAPYFRPYDLPAVTLTDQDGEPFELRARAAGKVTLLYFGYTSCPDVCPITMARVGRSLAMLEPEERARILPVFITLDPERDTPERIRDWIGALHPDIVGLTGPKERLDAAVEGMGFVFPDMERPEEGFYEVAHPVDLFLFTPELLGRFGYDHGEASPEEIAADLRTLVAFEWGGAGVTGSGEAEAPGNAETPGEAGDDARTEGVQVENAFALDPLGQERLAFYATLRNESARADALVGVASPTGRTASLHRMRSEDGMMRMEPVEVIPLPPGATVRLEPGGLHAMLEDLLTSPAAGDSLEVTFRFANTDAVTRWIPVRHPADVTGHP